MSFSKKNSSKTAQERMGNAIRARAVARGPHRRLAHMLDSPLLRGLALVRRPQDRREMGFHRKKSLMRRFSLRFWAYFYKMRGKNPATYDFSVADTLWSFGGAFLGMLALALINVEVWGRHEQGLLLGSFGASTMLVFGAPHAPFAQPRNVIGGHMVSALVGVLAQNLAGVDPWLAAALAVALAVAGMHVTATLHPPGGATALLAVVGSPELKSFGFEFVLYPVGVSVVALVVVGVLYNNLCARRRYPLNWW